MNNPKQHVLLDEHGDYKLFRTAVDRLVDLQLGEKQSTVITVLRTGSFYHPVHGDFTVDQDLFRSMIENFDAKTYGQEIALDVAYRPDLGAAGFIRTLFVQNDKLRARVELNDYGIKSIKKKGFIYVSAKYTDNYIDNETKAEHGPALLGAVLVVYVLPQGAEVKCRQCKQGTSDVNLFNRGSYKLEHP